LQTVGYREFVDYFENKKELDNCIEEVKASTRQYAKRQMTWFKKDLSIQWCAPEWEEVKKILP
jgi:tRNA dimethylallyltransferase